MKKVILLLFVIYLGKLEAQNWNQFRGPDQTGIIDGFEIPTEWNADVNLKWRVPNPGKGWSSPIVWGDKI